MKKYSYVCLMTLLALGSAQAALVWNGSDDGISLYKEGNWIDHSGATPAANTINPGTLITADTGGLIEITAGTGSPNAFNGDFILGTNDSLTIGNGKVLASSSAAPVTANGTAALALTNGATVSIGAITGFTGATVTNSSLTLIDSQGMVSGDTNGSPFAIGGTSDVTAQFLSKWDVTLSDSADLTLNGGDNPLNGTTIDFDADWTGQLYLSNETVADTTSEHLSKFTVDGAPAEDGVNIYILSDSGAGSYVQIADPAPPAFVEDPFTNAYAEAGAAYTNTVVGSATGFGLVYSNLTAGTWLNITADGTITGTPAESDIGNNTFTVQVTDEFARSTNATMIIEVKEVIDPAWEYNFDGTATSDADFARRYTAFGTVQAGLGDGTVLAVNSNPSANNNTGPGFFYLRTGMDWEPNTLYTIDFVVANRSNNTQWDGAIAEYGLYAGLPADDLGEGDLDYANPAVTGSVSPWIASSNKSLGVEGQITLDDNIEDGSSTTVSKLTGTTATDVSFTFTTGNDVSSMGEMVFFVRSGDDGTATGKRIHVDEFEIYATPAIEVPDTPGLSIESGSDSVVIHASNLSAAGYVVNYLQYKDSLTVATTWSNLYSVTGVTETNWVITTSNSPAFYRIESTY